MQKEGSRIGKVIRVLFVTISILFGLLSLTYWYVALRSSSISYRFLDGHSMVRHGLQGSGSHGPNHGWEWGIYSWKESFASVVAKAKAELSGWKLLTSDPTEKINYATFQDNMDHEITIYSMELPPKGEFWRESTREANPNSVVVMVVQALPDNLYEEIRSRNLRTEP